MVATRRGKGATSNLYPTVAVRGLGVESVTLMLTANNPDRVGVPPSVPLEESVIPGGNSPDAMPQEYGMTPPVATRAAL